MSFRCTNCNEAQPGDHNGDPKPIKHITKKRHKSYVGGGQGWEIVKEAHLCGTCFNQSKPAEFVVA